MLKLFSITSPKKPVANLMALLRPFLTLLVFAGVFAPYSFADVQDPFDPFTSQLSKNDPDQLTDKTADELINEARVLLADERLLDARTRLLQALKKDPKKYEAHMLLAGYYSVHVGHFRLALKYIKQAIKLFKEKYGSPPYTDPLTRALHAHLLYLLSQIRLNLDDYQGALDVLDQYSKLNYYDSWYPGSRAWILMKLGRLDEAIKVARLGIIAGAEPGRTLNVLGILLSMRGDSATSLEIFKQAIAYEMALGAGIGQPATPYNNAGEVFKEIFQEEKAEQYWLKATSLPDGCEHVLPSLNLAILYIEQINLLGAKRSMDNFESCVKQYPLRNGEEHRALVHLVRGRVAYHSGHIKEAIKHFETTLQKQQWFGKIGTSVEDLQAAALSSLAAALEADANITGFYRPESLMHRLFLIKRRLQSSLRAWWNMRRARQILTEKLGGFEDLYIRHSDSMLEYPTLGAVLAGFNTHTLKERIKKELSIDHRKNALTYYDLYLAQNLLAHSKEREALALIDKVLSRVRAPYDDLLKLQAILLKLAVYDKFSDDYIWLADQAFQINRAALRNHGLPLPCRIITEDHNIISKIQGSAFLPVNRPNLPYSISAAFDGKNYQLIFKSQHSGGWSVKAKGENLPEAVNRLMDTVFSVDL
ncbi:MAG: hypothetical protein D6719_06265 [Candidatus Dadabacteria bacterium]|nr:MAG: hypothetical protein D6719_06265 [Candidatus Dadabacteria bacterium]